MNDGPPLKIPILVSEATFVLNWAAITAWHTQVMPCDNPPSPVKHVRVLYPIILLVPAAVSFVA